MCDYLHATVEPFHLTQFHCVHKLFSTREGRVYFFLEAFVCFWIEQEVIEEGRKDATCCVGTSNDG